MVFGHNLQHMALFGIPNAANLLFSGWGMICGPQDPEFGSPDVPAGLGTFLGQKWGPKKDGFVEEMVPQWTVWQTKRGK